MHLQQPWYERKKKTISRPPGVLTIFGFHFAVSSPANNAKLLAEQPEAQTKQKKRSGQAAAGCALRWLTIVSFLVAWFFQRPRCQS